MSGNEKVRNVGILIFEGVELLDFCGPYEAFTAASKDGERYFNTFTVAEMREPVAANAGLRTVPDSTLEDALGSTFWLSPADEARGGRSTIQPSSSGSGRLQVTPS